MQPIITNRAAHPVPANLSSLARRINAAHAEARAAVNKGLSHAREAGELLIQAKEAVPHGQWLPWLKKHCPNVSERTVQVYMQITRCLPEIQIKSAETADLTLGGALRLIAEAKAPQPIADDVEYVSPEARAQAEAFAAKQLKRFGPPIAKTSNILFALFSDHTNLGYDRDDRHWVDWMEHQFAPWARQGFMPLIEWHDDGGWVFHTMLTPPNTKRVKAIAFAFSDLRNYSADILSAQDMEQLARLKAIRDDINADFYETALVLRSVRDRQLYRDRATVELLRTQVASLREEGEVWQETFATFDEFLLDAEGVDEAGYTSMCGPLIRHLEEDLAAAA